MLRKCGMAVGGTGQLCFPVGAQVLIWALDVGRIAGEGIAAAPAPLCRCHLGHHRRGSREAVLLHFCHTDNSAVKQPKSPVSYQI